MLNLWKEKSLTSMEVHCFGAAFAAYKLHLAWNVVGSKISPLQQLLNVDLSYGHFQFKHLAYRHPSSASTHCQGFCLSSG